MLAPEAKICQPLFAAASPGNARWLRAFLAAELRPVASAVLIGREKP
jgi:hypothetical protein